MLLLPESPTIGQPRAPIGAEPPVVAIWKLSYFVGRPRFPTMPKTPSRHDARIRRKSNWRAEMTEEEEEEEQQQQQQENKRLHFTKPKVPGSSPSDPVVRLSYGLKIWKSVSGGYLRRWIHWW